MRRAIVIALALCAAAALWLALRGAREEPESPPPAEATSAPAPGAAPAPSGAEAEEPAAEVSEPPPFVGELERPPAGFATLVHVVERASGAPVAGAALSLLDRGASLEATSDEHGLARLAPTRIGADQRLSVRADGFAEWRAETGTPHVLRVELARAARLAGRVSNADGDPVPFAELELAYDACDGCEPLRARTESDGSFVLEGAPLGERATLDVRADGFPRARRELELRGPGPLAAADIRLARPVELSGRVEDWSSGRAVAGARVGTLLARDDGAFAGLVESHPSGRARVEVSAPGHATLLAELALGGEPQVLRLPRLATVEGTLRGAGGALSGGLVGFGWSPALGDELSNPRTLTPPEALPEGWKYVAERLVTTTAADGRYALSVPPWAPGGAVSHGTESRAVPPLEPGASARADLAAARHASAQVVVKVWLGGRERPDLAATVRWSGTGSGSARLDGAGGDTLPTFPAGEYRFTAELDLLPGFPSPDVAVRLGAHALASVDLDVPAPARPEDAITGLVRYEGGAPVAGVEVAAWRDDPLEALVATALTDEQGAFELRVPALDLDHTVAVAPFLVWQEGVPPGLRGLELVIPSSVRVAVRARDAASGTALGLDDVELLARPAGERDFERLAWPFSLPDAEGWYEAWVPMELDLVALPHAAHLASHGLFARGGVRVERPDARIELLLEPGLDLAVELAPDAEPWPRGARLLLAEAPLADVLDPRGGFTPHPFGELAQRRAVDLGSGRATVRGLAPGDYVVLAADAANGLLLAVEPATVRVGPGAAPLRVRWWREE